MSLKLQKVVPRQRETLWRMMQLCMHDYSEFALFEIDRDGVFEYRWFEAYFTEPCRQAYFIVCHDEYAGFVMVRESDDEEEWDYQIAEFFILRRYRRQGVGGKAARLALNLHRGLWGVSYDESNTPAVQFWSLVVRGFQDFVWEPEPGQNHRKRYLIRME